MLIFELPAPHKQRSAATPQHIRGLLDSRAALLEMRPSDLANQCEYERFAQSSALTSGKFSCRTPFQVTGWKCENTFANSSPRNIMGLPCLKRAPS
mmetsp:Transcript_20722/g.55409  ORF Transcript_20722/g.55409 Transcript_20722/m.55409 type:complete len:96 (-) Transcript_20722:418-705(-)